MECSKCARTSDCSQHFLRCHPWYFHHPGKVQGFLGHPKNHQPILNQSKVSHLFSIRQVVTLLLSGNHPKIFPATSAFVFSCLMEQSSCNGSCFITAWFSINPAVPFTPSGTSPRSSSFSHSHLTLLCQSSILAEHQINL